MLQTSESPPSMRQAPICPIQVIAWARAMLASLWLALGLVVVSLPFEQVIVFIVCIV
jgi:hypothetical protein